MNLVVLFELNSSFWSHKRKINSLIFLNILMRYRLPSLPSFTHETHVKDGEVRFLWAIELF